MSIIRQILKTGNSLGKVVLNWFQRIDVMNTCISRWVMMWIYVRKCFICSLTSGIYFHRICVLVLFPYFSYNLAFLLQISFHLYSPIFKNINTVWKSLLWLCSGDRSAVWWYPSKTVWTSESLWRPDRDCLLPWRWMGFRKSWYVTLTSL